MVARLSFGCMSLTSAAWQRFSGVSGCIRSAGAPVCRSKLIARNRPVPDESVSASDQIGQIPLGIDRCVLQLLRRFRRIR